MPELPDVEVYVERLAALTAGMQLEGLELRSPFLVRTVAPPPEAAVGRTVRGAERIGKRIVLAFDGELFFVLHLMIAGRLRWRAPGAKAPGGRTVLAVLRFPRGVLIWTEAGTKKRASLHVVEGRQALAPFRRGGLEPLDVETAELGRVLRAHNHTLKRALTDPRLLSGIGNAWSDEILHAAKLSPLQWTARLTDEEIERLAATMRSVLGGALARIRAEVGEGFPETVTAFRLEMAVHGKYREPCPVCGAPVQRIRAASNECNYCPRCQTGGRVLADRGLSQLLRGDWPKSLEELDELYSR